MAFLKKKSKSTMLKVFLFLILSVLVLCSFYFIYNIKLSEMKAHFDEEIQKYQYELYALERQALIPKQDIEFGTVLSRELFEYVSLKLDIQQELLLDESDMGKTCMIGLPAGIPVTKSSVAANYTADDLRKVEFNMFLIQTDQMKGDYIDVRILFPNAENYIVLSKKQIKDMNLSENTIWLWLNEEELHLVSSAIIDAYLNPGTKLYVTTYVQPEIQEAATVYYPPNQDVLSLMRKDPNILKKASDALAAQTRTLLESHLNAMTTDELGRISSGVNEEIAKTNNLIKNYRLNQASLSGQDDTATEDEIVKADENLSVPSEAYN